MPFSMICTIHFYDQAFTTSQEIHYIITDDMLAKKFHTQSLVSDILPQYRFSQSLVLTIFACEFLK